MKYNLTVLSYTNGMNTAPVLTVFNGISDYTLMPGINVITFTHDDKTKAVLYQSLELAKVVTPPPVAK